MKHLLKTLYVTVLALPGLLQAQPTAHYCPGVLGLQAASLPPPGWYVCDYNVFYTADRWNNSSGQNAGPANFKAFTYAQVPRVIWISDKKFLGADVGGNILLPILDNNLRAGSYDSSTFGIADLLVEGLLGWHPERFDFAVGYGLWMPTGDSAPPLTTRAGLGDWTGMLTAGGTWYMDKDKTWAVSALNRYELNTEQRDTHITPGQAYTLEWGVSKQLQKSLQIGVAGYYQQKVTTDRGAGASSNRDRVAAVGPEISGAIPKLKMQVSVRYLYEFMAENRAQGQTIALTLIKHF